MKINVNDFLLKAVTGYWNTDIESEDINYDNYIFEQDDDHSEFVYIDSISVQDIDDEADILYRIDIQYEYCIQLLNTDDDIKIKYSALVYYIIKVSPDSNEIENIIFKYYIKLNKSLSVYYNKYQHRSHNYRHLTYTVLNLNPNRHKEDIFNVPKQEIYDKEMSDMNLIIGKYEKDIIENDKYGEYDSLLMVNLYNIISDYSSDIYEICGKRFIVYLGKNKEESIYADIKVIYLDDPVCEEEMSSGYFIDFEIEIMDKKYIMTYCVHLNCDTDIEDSIYKVDRVLDDKNNKESLYISTFNIELHEIEDSLSEQEAELNYTVV